MIVATKLPPNIAGFPRNGDNGRTSNETSCKQLILDI